LQRFLVAIRDGTFVTRARMTAWSTLLLTGYAAAILYLGLTAHGMNDYAGRPLGSDFSNVYAAGVAASHGDATAPFDILRQQKAEQALFGSGTPLYGWHYPPFFLLVAATLAQLPYLPALILWQGVTLLLYMGALALLLRRSVSPGLARDPLWIPLALGFTAVFVNLTHGHNGFLTAALFGAALAMLDERPLVAGALFGLLAYKPQFAMVIPLALAAGGRWRAFVAAAVAVFVLAALVTGLFGESVWPAFLASTHFTRVTVLEQGSTGFNKIQSVFAWVRLWGGSVPLAYGAQALVTLTVAAMLARLWRGPAGAGLKGAGLCLAALLTTPYSLDYDLMLLAPAIALLAAEGRAFGFPPYQMTLLAILWLMPVAVREIAQVTYFPLAVPAMMASFWLVCRRAYA
jgi:hypothetical protein